MNSLTMNILFRLIIITIFVTSLLSGCHIRPAADKPFTAGEFLYQPKMTETAAATEITPPVTIERAPPATSGPATPAVKKTPVTTLGERSIKPRLSYTVSAGDQLWSIAKRPDIYGDPLLWPLLYQANRDQIKDPRKIYTGQTLSIPRNSSDAEREDARNQAKNSNFFPQDDL